MTTDFKIDEIVILKNNEEREEIIAKNGEFILDTYGPIKLKDIPNKEEYLKMRFRLKLYQQVELLLRENSIIYNKNI